MIIDDIKAAKISVAKGKDNHYLVKLKRPKACPQCKNALVRKGAICRTIHDLDNEGRPVKVSISYPRYYCSQCRKFVKTNKFDKIMPKSKYSDNFKNTLLREIVADPTKPYTKLCEEYGVSKSTVEVWLKSANADLQNKLCRFEPTENLIICPFAYGPKDCLLLMSANNNRHRILTIDDKDILDDGAIFYCLDLITRKWPEPHTVLVGDHNLISAVECAVSSTVILSKQALYNMAYTCIADFNKTHHWYSQAQVEDMAHAAAQQINDCRDKDPCSVLGNLSKCASRLNEEVWSSQEELYVQLIFLTEYLLPHDIDDGKCQIIIDKMEEMYARGISFDLAVYIIMMHDGADEISI